MLNLPSRPLKKFLVDEDDEFIKEAKRKRNYTEPCWCGSKLQYKKCHRTRSSAKPVSLGKARSEQRKIFWKSRECMHPSASPETCRGRVIDSHTIQRKGPLAKIVDTTNHVYHIETDHKSFEFKSKSLSWRKASVFPGYCSHHDTELFRELEAEAFEGTKKQCVLQSFRSVCSELYKKRALVESLNHQKRTIDAGRDLHRQIEIQLSINRGIEGNTKSIEELEQLQATFHRAILMEDWDNFECKVYFFEGEIDLISTAVIQVDYDFNGKQFVDLFDLEQDAETISYSILSTDSGGAIMFCWPKESEYLGDFIASFNQIENKNKGDIFAQYCFLSSESTFFSKTWWDQLSEQQQDRIFSL